MAHLLKALKEMVSPQEERAGLLTAQCLKENVSPQAAKPVRSACSP